MHIRRGLQCILVLISMALLSACSLPRMIDSDVQSFAGSTLPVSPADFRFDRLPSQQQNLSLQDTLEQMAQEALERVGLSRNDTSGRYLAQISVGVDDIRNPHYRPPRPRLVRGADGKLYEEWPLAPDLEVPGTARACACPCATVRPARSLTKRQPYSTAPGATP